MNLFDKFLSFHLPENGDFDDKRFVRNFRIKLLYSEFSEAYEAKVNSTTKTDGLNITVVINVLNSSRVDEKPEGSPWRLLFLGIASKRETRSKVQRWGNKDSKWIECEHFSRLFHESRFFT